MADWEEKEDASGPTWGSARRAAGQEEGTLRY